MKMKPIYTLLLGLTFLPLTTFANAELVQIVNFNWNETTKQLEVASFGSGTAIAKDTVITNKHVVKVGDKASDFLLLCPAQVQNNRAVKCNVAAGVSVLHNTLDVALVKTLNPEDFLFSTKVSTAIRSKEDIVTVVGFPTTGAGYAQNFGGTKTVEAITAWQEDPGQGLNIKGDTPTTTRGQVLARYLTENNGALYTKTDAKVNFGNSGGAAFDQFGGYIGIPTLKDTAGNSYILEYAQVHDWVQQRSNRKARPNGAAYSYYQSLMKPRVSASRSSSLSNVSTVNTVQSTSVCSSRCQYFKRLAAKRAAKNNSTRNTTTRNYNSPYSSRSR